MTAAAPARENAPVGIEPFPKWGFLYDGTRIVVETLLEGCLGAQIIWRDSTGIARLRHLLGQTKTTPQQIHDHAVTMSRTLVKHIADIGGVGALDGDGLTVIHRLRRERAFWRALVALLFGRRCMGHWPDVAVGTVLSFDGPDDAAADLTERADGVLREIGAL
jgi:hypothetical protein